MATHWNDFIAEFFDRQAIKDDKQMEQLIRFMYSRNYEKIEQLIGRTFSQFGDENGLLSYEQLFVFNRFERLKNEVNEAIKTTTKDVEKTIEKKLDATIEQSILRTMFIGSMMGLKKFTINEKEFQKIKDLQWYGEKWNGTVKRSGDDFVRNLMNTITTTTNEPVDMKRLMKEIKKNHESQVKKTTTVFTTENSRKQTDAITTSFSKVAKNGQFTEHYIWTATLDEKTCDTCGKELDGKVVTKESVKYPNHPRCRCVLVPKMDDFFEQIEGRGERDQTSFVSSWTNEKTFNDWLVSLPKHTELSKKNKDWIEHYQSIKK